MKPDVWNNNDLHPKHNYVPSPKTKTHVDREVSQAIMLWGIVRDRNSKTRKAEGEDEKRPRYYSDKTGKNKYLDEQGLGQRDLTLCVKRLSPAWSPVGSREQFLMRSLS